MEMREKNPKTISHTPFNYTQITAQRKKNILEILGRFYPNLISYNKIKTILHEEYGDVRVHNDTVKSIIKKLEKDGDVEVQEEKLQGVSANIRLTEETAKEYSPFGKELHKIKNYKNLFEEHIKPYLIKLTPTNMIGIHIIESDFEHMLDEEKEEILNMDISKEHKNILLGEIIKIKKDMDKTIKDACLKDEYCNKILSKEQLKKNVEEITVDASKAMFSYLLMLKDEEDKLVDKILEKLPDISSSDMMKFLEKYKILIQLEDNLEDSLLSDIMKIDPSIKSDYLLKKFEKLKNQGF